MLWLNHDIGDDDIDDEFDLNDKVNDYIDADENGDGEWADEKEQSWFMMMTMIRKSMTNNCAT